MPIVARCSCGKKIGVGDALAGRTVRCPACGGDVLVTPAAPTAATAAQRPKAKVAPAVTVSPAIVISAVVGALLVVTVAVLYFGPWRVGNQWADLRPKASRDVTDVVMYALQANQSAALAGGPMAGSAFGKTPAIEGDPVFVPPMMAFSMPRRIIVSGHTSQGAYLGTYDTTSGEVVVTVDVGGYTVGGLVDLRKASDKLHVTGRQTNGQVTAEADGEPLVIVTPKYRGRHGELGD